jgi:hypothetical protein
LQKTHKEQIINPNSQKIVNCFFVLFLFLFLFWYYIHAFLVARGTNITKMKEKKKQKKREINPEIYIPSSPNHSKTIIM